jgi:uncharacterized protein YndB with AHSA1/START domain
MSTQEKPSVERNRNSPATKPAERVLVITRVFDAPRSLVFKAWTDPEHVVRWWGPKGFTTPFCKIDFRPGGVFHYCMRSPEGRDFWGKGIYREIVEPERIVFTDFFADKEGNPVPATHYGMSPDWPAEMLVSVTFGEHEDKTKATLQHVGIPSGTEGDSCEVGWTESLERLAEHLAKVLSQAKTPSAQAARAA